MKRIAVFSMVLLCLVLTAPLAAHGPVPRTQVATGQSLTISAEIVAFDAATRKISLKGPLGGTVDGVLTEEVKDLTKFKVGDMVSATYYEAIAASLHRKGDARPLFSAADVAAKAQMGTPDSTSVTRTVTVFSVDLPANTVVMKGADGTLHPVTVQRPEFQAKLKDLKTGDQVDITYSEALVSGLRPMAPGEEAKATMKVGTLVIDSGEIVKRNQNVLMIRNASGRMIKVVVEGDFKFNIDGKEMTVYELKEGTRLTRTAIRVKEVSYSG